MDSEIKERLKALRENMKSYGYMDGVEELDAIFPELRESYNHEYDGNMDKECIELCDTLNELPGVKTFESCCGHLKDRYSIWFFCEDIDTISRLGRSVDRNYSDGKWEIIVDSTDTNPRGVFWLRSKTIFASYGQMNESTQRLIESILHWFNSDFDSYFRESEDERIRKCVTEIVKCFAWRDGFEPVTKEKCLAWLEKQKEQEPITDSVKFEEGFKTGLEVGLRKQKEQKSIPVPPPCWESAIQEQKPAEWSEEDEKNIYFLTRLIELYIKDGRYETGDGTVTKPEIIKMLKSLRPSWKPSEEQMGALNYAYCELFKREDIEHNILGPLQRLCDDLMKL